MNVQQTEVIQGGVYRITTHSGKSYSITRMPLRASRIRWIDATLSRMRRQNKQLYFGWPTKNTPQPHFVKLNCPDCPYFMLAPWIKGPWPSPTSRLQMNACGLLLAKFHLAASKISIPTKGRPQKAHSALTYFQQELRVLQLTMRSARRSRQRSPLDMLLLKHEADIIPKATMSLQALQRSGYVQACRKQKLTVCHGDFGPTNLIQTKKGLAIIDFETLRLDHRTYDLYRAIYNFCQTNDWSFKTAQAFLDGYQTIFPLRRLDFKILKAMLHFPRGISKHILHYKSKPTALKREIVQDFPRAMSYELKRNRFVKQLETYAKQNL